jgi:hypothetical protein
MRGYYKGGPGVLIPDAKWRETYRIRGTAQLIDDRDRILPEHVACGVPVQFSEHISDELPGCSNMPCFDILDENFPTSDNARLAKVSSKLSVLSSLGLDRVNSVLYRRLASERDALQRRKDIAMENVVVGGALTVLQGEPKYSRFRSKRNVMKGDTVYVKVPGYYNGVEGFWGGVEGE